MAILRAPIATVTYRNLVARLHAEHDMMFGMWVSKQPMAGHKDMGICRDMTNDWKEPPMDAYCEGG